MKHSYLVILQQAVSSKTQSSVLLTSNREAGAIGVRAKGSVWGILYADDAGIVSKPSEGLAKMMTVIVTVFEAAGLTVSEKKIEATLL